MNIQHDRAASDVRVPSSVYRKAIRYVAAFDREVRMDGPATQGSATSWFTRSAFQDGDLASAHRYADLERSEWDIVGNGVFQPWLSDILEYCLSNLSEGPSLVLPLRVPSRRFWEELDALSLASLETLHRAIDSESLDRLDDAQRSLRMVHIATNDSYVSWIQDLLTHVAEASGDSAVENLTRISYERVWRRRYRGWYDMEPLEKLALTCAGMRAHYGGPGRFGDFSVEDQGDRYVMTFDPCGSGGVLRRQAAGHGVGEDALPGNRAIEGWSWGLKGVPWYCSHCPLLLEKFPLEDFGTVMRLVEFDSDPWQPTKWIILKEQRLGTRTPTSTEESEAR